MKALTAIILVLLTVFALTTGCSGKEDETPVALTLLPDDISGLDSKPGFKTVNIKKSTLGEHPSFVIVVENISNDPGYYVGYVMQALKYNTIIDTATGQFAGGRKIKPGEKAKKEAYFPSLKSHDDYDHVRYTLE